MKKNLLKFMVRLSLPISILSVFGALSGCSNSGKIGWGKPMGGSLVPPEDGEVQPMLRGDVVPPLRGRAPALEKPTESEVLEEGIPMVTSGIMLPPDLSKDKASDE